MDFANILYLPLSTFVIDIPRRGVRITRKHSDELKNFIKLRLSPSSSSLRIAAAFRTISEDLHEDVDEFCESRLESFRRQMQLLNMITLFYSTRFTLRHIKIRLNFFLLTLQFIFKKLFPLIFLDLHHFL